MDFQDTKNTMSPWMGRGIVFSVGAAMMMMEIAAGRVMAPTLGVSLYTWTSVILAVLIGVGMGSALGGRMADRFPSRQRLGDSCFGAGFIILLASMFPRLLDQVAQISSLDVWIRTLLYAFIVFLPPACALAIIPPQVARQTLENLKQTGRVVGSLGAWNAFGSIAGTYAAGDWLIALLGTGRLLTLTAGGLMAMGAWIARTKAHRMRVAVVGGMFFFGNLLLPSICLRETNYYCVRVTKGEEVGKDGWILRLDHLIHSYVVPKEPDLLGYSYEQVYANVIASRFGKDDAFSAFFIGGGGYVLPRYLNAFYPNADVTVTEIDPEVTEVNRRFLGLSPNANIRTINHDARMALAKDLPDGSFHLVFGDAFNDFSVPYHLTTVEFHRLLKRKMAADGVYAMNVIDDADHGQFLAAMIRTLHQVWRHVEVAPQAMDFRNGRNTFVLLASDVAFDRRAWEAARPFSETHDEQARASREKNIHLLSPEEVGAFLALHSTPALTDDFAPTDSYLAPLFREGY